jgi:hypothetical protein
MQMIPMTLDLWEQAVDEPKVEAVFSVRRQDGYSNNPDKRIIGRVPRSIPELRTALRLYRALAEQNAHVQAEQVFRSIMVGLDRLG